MPALLLPRSVRKAIDLLRGDLGYPWRIDELALLCVVPRRTLEKHFKRFVGCSPLEFLRKERLNQARRNLLRAPPDANVTAIATDCGFSHLGRFALAYRDHYGESPSDTLRWGRIPANTMPSALRLTGCADRPTLAVCPFDLDGRGAVDVGDIGDEIAAAMSRTGWIKLVLRQPGGTTSTAT